jgi:hypothetical protein
VQAAWVCGGVLACVCHSPLRMRLGALSTLETVLGSASAANATVRGVSQCGRRRQQAVCGVSKVRAVRVCCVVIPAMTADGMQDGQLTHVFVHC